MRMRAAASINIKRSSVNVKCVVCLFLNSLNNCVLMVESSISPSSH